LDEEGGALLVYVSKDGANFHCIGH